IAASVVNDHGRRLRVVGSSCRSIRMPTMSRRLATRFHRSTYLITCPAASCRFASMALLDPPALWHYRQRGLGQRNWLLLLDLDPRSTGERTPRGFYARRAEFQPVQN